MTAEGLVDPCTSWRAFAWEPASWLEGGRPIALSEDCRPPCGEAVTTAVSDEELMRLYRGGDHEAFRKLYDRYRAPLMRFIRRLALDRADVEEIAQETWMAVISRRERYVPHARFVAYLFSIARRRGMDRWRRRGRHPESEEALALEQVPAPAQSQPESLVGEEALAGAIAVALDALPLLQREAFLLRAETDLTIEEIAEVTGTTRETAKSRLRYGLRRLRAALEPWT